MEERFARNIPALSEAQCALLRGKKAAVIGCGGLGGYLVELLTRVGIGSIRAVDGDVFDRSNLNRQILCDMSRLGTGKAAAAVQRALAINPAVKAEGIDTFLTPENAASLIEGCDVVLDALDNVPSRRVLAAACDAAGIPCIYGAIQGWVAQAAVSLPWDGLIERLYPADVEIRDKSVLSFTPALCASLQAALCVKLLTGQDVPAGKILYFDLFDQEFEMISFN